MTKYIEWCWPEHTIIEYEREGDCNRCGQCCTATLYYGLEVGKPPVVGIELDGSVIPVTFDPDFRVAHLPCEYLTMQGCEPTCRIQADKPDFCDTWPTNPRQIEGLSECSYSFREVRRLEWEWDT